MPTLNVNALDTSSIDDAIAYLKGFEKAVRTLETEVPYELAQRGAATADAAFSAAPYNVNHHVNYAKDITVSAVNNGIAGSVISADGSDVCFVEFGAGITWDTGYMGTRPAGVVGIGQYGKGNGKRPYWRLPASLGGYWTTGTPPANAMFQAEQTVRQDAAPVTTAILAREIAKL